MTSKGVMDRQRWAKALIAVARAHAAEVGDHLRQHFARHFADASPDGGTHPDFTVLHIQLARALELRLAEMVAADERHLAERDDDRDARRRRDTAAEEIHRQIIELRELVSGVWGPEGVLRILGVQGPTPRSPVQLERCAEQIVDRLRALRVQGLPEPVAPGVEVDLTPWVERLASRREELRTILEALAVARRHREATQRDKDWALAAMDRTARGVARLLEGSYHLADCANYSRQLRVSSPRSHNVPSPNEKEV